ncbi:MAG TPA: hypothetical protein QF611_13905 [Pseudomonadales bacterium]|nr:hypothetical protein [Gammaproteobacteria bacterium]MDP6024318.1 hypothetical protein [Pseudomonadales bacterium]MDP7316508.1 hypothetical protein [Pseudomonadales bacterium]HJP52120.1 hypothetical protein [Pseudomonadales bacterium]
MLTKSLLFVALTDGKHYLRALDKDTSQIIHEVELPLFSQGAPMTCVADGKQYISLAVSGFKDSKLMTLAPP